MALWNNTKCVHYYLEELEMWVTFQSGSIQLLVEASPVRHHVDNTGSGVLRVLYHFL